MAEEERTSGWNILSSMSTTVATVTVVIVALIGGIG